MTLAVAFIAAYACVLSVVLGTLALILLANLTTATWFQPLRPRATAVIATLPVLAMLGIVATVLVIMVDRSAPIHSPSARSVYLAPWFVVVRAVMYWVVWLLIARSVRSTRVTSAIGLVALGFTMSFASIDWMMSLGSDWQSTIYGVYWTAGGLVGAIAVLSVFANRTASSDAMPRLSIEQWQSLGKLMLTFVMFWVYAGFSQYIVIWSADLPREVGWYVVRTRGVWGFAALSSLILGVAFPLLALLQSSIRRSRSWLGSIGLLLLGVHVVDSFWLVMPGLAAVEWWTPFVLALALILVASPVVALAHFMRPG